METNENFDDLKTDIMSKSCSNCQSITSIVWHRQHKAKDDIWFCNFCQTKKRLALADNVQVPGSNDISPAADINAEETDECQSASTKPKSKTKLSPANAKRRSKSRQFTQKPSTRMSRQNSASSAVVNKLAASTRSKPRKHVRKSVNPEKSIFETASVSTSGLLWHNGMLFSEGDIVSVVDEVDNRPYYARIRGLLKDHFLNKFAALTWMLPKPSANLEEQFEISDFVAGPHDEKLYDINCLEFICHSPRKSDSNLNREPKCRLNGDADDDLNPEKQFAVV